MQSGKTATDDPLLQSTRMPASLRKSSKGVPADLAATQDVLAVQVLEVESRFIKLELPDSWRALAAGDSVELVFRLGGYHFTFTTSVSRLTADGIVWLAKPTEIDKKRVRNSSRTDTHTQVHYTLWTEVGRYQGELLDVSEDGLRMLAYQPLQPWDLIHIDMYLAEPGVRINVQATVIWCSTVEDGKNLFEAGLQFHTLADSVRIELRRYAGEDSLDAAHSRV